jgi:hypothetical protein
MSRRFAWFVGNRDYSASVGSTKRSARRRLLFEPLEAKNLMHGDVDCDGSIPVAESAAGEPGVVVPILTTTAEFRVADVVAPFPTEIFDPMSDPRTRDQMMGLPLLDSNLGAPVTLYLDFNGNFESDWWNGTPENQTHYANVSTPIWDMDGNPAAFGPDERAMIAQIWARVAEDFSPFNINVSTAYYGGFADGQALRVAIGGDDSDWLNEPASGVASIGSFSNIAPNVVFAFDLVPAANVPGAVDYEGKPLNATAAMASTISHEAGHAFGLRHHSRYRVDGTLIATYDTGNAGWTPIMGNSLSSDRVTWEHGPTDLGAGTSQDDVEILASPTNVFGLRADDHGNSNDTADPLTSSVAIFAPMTGKGIIEQMRDVDVFRFNSPGGTIKVQVSAAVFGPNAIPVAELWSTSGFVSRANAGSLTQSIINANVAAGTYFVRVRGFGDYGSIGQYSVSVTHQPLATTGGATTGVVSQPRGTLTVAPTIRGTTLQRALAAGALGAAADGTTVSQPAANRVLTASRRPAAERHDAVFAMIE